MSDLFDFNFDGKTSFEEQMFGTMLVMGAFNQPEQNVNLIDTDDPDYDPDADCDPDDIDVFDGDGMDDGDDF